MSKITKEGIVELISRYTRTYQDNPSIMLSGYRQEKQTVADYNGRQILELMQNADDAKSEIIKIVLDTEHHLLTLSNNGTAFSLDGIESLMYTGLSTKNKEEYIGNKGLGFRSILNWVQHVTIKTHEVSFRFSKEYSEKHFDKELLPKNLVHEKIKKEILEKKLQPDEKPIAVLAFPEIVSEIEEEFVTTIVIKFRESELPKIEEQLRAISDEVLLFLPNTKEILFIKDGIEINKIVKTKDEATNIVINEKDWKIERHSDLKYTDETLDKPITVKFNYAIAWQEQQEIEGKFYNYFPTSVETDLPSIIHATFDLTSNRNELNNSDANKYILKNIAETLGIIADEKLKKETSDWDAYYFLSPSSTNKKPVFTDFYQSLKTKREIIGVYPTVDNGYVTKDKAIYHGVEFSKWVEQNGFGSSFPNLLKVPNQNISVPEFAFKKYEASELVEICKKISYKINNHTSRAELIKLFTHEDFQKFHSSSEYLPLLISSEYKFEEHSYDETVFTLKNADRDFYIPDEFSISFIEPSFYQALVSVFDSEIENARENIREGKEDRGRTLKRILKDVVDLGSNDITDVVRFIVSKANERINKNETGNENIVVKLIKTLFSVFDPVKNAGSKTTVNNIPLLNRTGHIAKAEDLFFGDDYLSHLCTEEIFNEVYTSDHYLLSTEKIGFDDVEESVLLSFFEWLGVNKLISISKNEDLNGHDLYGYFDFLFYTVRLTKPDQATKYNSSLKAIKINNIDAVAKLPLNKLLILLEKSTELKREINLTFENNSARLFFKYGNAYPKEINVPSSFIFYQISNLVHFSEYTVSEDSEFQIMFTQIDLNDSFFTERLDKNQMASLKLTLKTLGTSESISDISEDRIKYLLQNQQTKFPNGNNSQSFYKKCLEYFLQKYPNNSIQDDVTYDLSEEYFARKGIDNNAVEIVGKERVFYSDNLLLPKAILQNFYFINLPRRIGEENVKRIFDVKLIKDELSKIYFDDEKTNYNHKLTLELNTYIEKLKPYFLCYRLEQIKLSKKAEAQLIKPLKLKVVTELKYQFDGGDVNVLAENEFLPLNDCFYVRTNLNDLNSLKSYAEFCDLIAEIVGMTFKVSSSKNTFRRIFKDGVKDSFHIIKSDGMESTLDEAKKLLGISDDEKIFWTKILKTDLHSLEDGDLLKEEIEKKLAFSLPDYYSNVDFSTLGNKNGVQFLIWLSKNIELKLESLITEHTLENWHTAALDNFVKNETNKFEQLLWNKTNESTIQTDKECFFQKTLDFDYIPQDLLKRFTAENAFNLNPQYKEAIINWTIERFAIDLNQDLLHEIVVKTKYGDLIKEFQFAPTVELMEKIIQNENPSLYSLMYFDNIDKLVREECCKQQVELESDISISDNDLKADESLNVHESYLLFVQSNVNKSHNSKNHTGSYNSKLDRNKAIAGKKAENRVENALLSNGYKVIPVASKTDSKHYDFDYLKDGETEWRFLEVKKDSGGYFFMSKAEKETAISSGASDKYDIAIVTAEDIHIIKSPFKFEDETFEKNSNFHAEPTEFKISFKIKNGI